MTTLRPPALQVFALGLAGLGATSGILGYRLIASGEGGLLHPATAMVGALVFIVGAAGLLTERTRVVSAMVIAGYSLFWSGMQTGVGLAAEGGIDPSRFVTASEALGMGGAAWLAAAMALPAAADGRWARIVRAGWVVGPVCLAVMLLLFGVVHLMEREAIGGMIPSWMPARSVWPWLTGLSLIAAAVAIATRRAGALAATLVGAMFASWILLVHAGRLVADPSSLGEWNFAIGAVALTGTAWVVARGLAGDGTKV